NPPFLVDGSIEKVEQVTACSAIADTTTLDRIPRCYILRRPSLSAVKSSSDIEKPHTWKRWRRTTIFAVSAMKVGSACFAAKECKGRARGITSYDGGKYSVEHRSATNNRSTYICILAPSHALVGFYGDVRVVVIGLVAEIHSPVGADAGGWGAHGLLAA